MDQRLLVVNRSHHGCTLMDGGKALAWYPHLAPALQMAWLLADASALRDGSPACVELHDLDRAPRRIHHGNA